MTSQEKHMESHAGASIREPEQGGEANYNHHDPGSITFWGVKVEIKLAAITVVAVILVFGLIVLGRTPYISGKPVPPESVILCGISAALAVLGLIVTFVVPAVMKRRRPVIRNYTKLIGLGIICLATLPGVLAMETWAALQCTTNDACRNLPPEMPL